MNQEVVIEWSVASVFRTLLMLAGVFVLLDIAGMSFALITGHDYVFGLLGLIDLDAERGVGTIFQVLLLLANAGLFILASRGAASSRVEKGPWLFLAFVFLFLTLDEFSFLHERTMPAVKALIGNAGIFYFGWIVPYGIAVIALAVWIAPKILRLSPEPRRFFVLAAVAYLSGALLMEALGGWRLDVIGGPAARPEVIYESITTVEETLEMLGLILLSRALLGMIAPGYPQLRLKLSG